MLAINSADDARNPAETGLTVAALQHLKNTHLLLILAGPETRGHATTAMARFWAPQLAGFLASAPKLPI